MSYAHMCKTQHAEIGHNDSGEDERCPLCQALDANALLESKVKALEELAHKFLKQIMSTEYDPGWEIPSEV